MFVVVQQLNLNQVKIWCLVVRCPNAVVVVILIRIAFGMEHGCTCCGITAHHGCNFNDVMSVAVRDRVA